jgi:hypothetical protein
MQAVLVDRFMSPSLTPVFATAALGPTIGYLIGFILATLVVNFDWFFCCPKFRTISIHYWRNNKNCYCLHLRIDSE